MPILCPQRLPPMPKKVTITLHLVEESNEIPDHEILREITEAFSQEDLLIPWCDRIKKISLDDA